MLAKVSFGSVTSEIMAAFWEWWCCGLGINREILCHPPSPQYRTSVEGAREKHSSWISLQYRTRADLLSARGCARKTLCATAIQVESEDFWTVIQKLAKVGRIYVAANKTKLLKFTYRRLWCFGHGHDLAPGLREEGVLWMNILQLEQKQEKWSILGVQCKTKVTAVYFLYFFRRVADI